MRNRTYPPGYGVVEPVANYRPWDVDEGFQRIYRMVKDHTMVDVYRLWVLWLICTQLTGDGDVLEVGSWRGGSGTLIAEACAPRKVSLADTFRGIVKVTGHDTYYKGGEHANTSAKIVRDLVARAGLSNVDLLEGVFPDDTAGLIAGSSFCLCHIDVDVYQSAKETFEWVWPRMVDGGVVVFDDYGFYGCEGVTDYVKELMQREGVIVVPNISGQAIVMKATS